MIHVGIDSAEWFHQPERTSPPNVEPHEEHSRAAHSPSPASEGPFGTSDNEYVVASSQEDYFSLGDSEASTEVTLPEHIANDRVTSYHSEHISSYDPEANAPSSNDAAVTVPVDSSVHTSLPKQGQVYGLDDQPFGPGHKSSDAPAHTMTPPPQTGSPNQIDDHTRYPTDASIHNGPLRSQSIDDPYHPTHHSRKNSDESHTGSAYSPPEPTLTPWNPYVPASVSETSRRNSSASASYEPYDPHGSHTSSNGIAETSHDPYAPSSRLHRVQSRQSDFSYTGEYTSRYNYPNVTDPGQSRGVSDVVPPDPDTTLGPANIVTAPTYAPYAPSPSLLGTNDPLGRAAARIPVISFGFGGKLVSCFHSAGETSGGFDVALTARQSTDVQLRTLHEVIPASAMDSSTSSYPGPLFSDPGSSSISLARTVGVGTANNIKVKRTQLSKWLEERANEISSGVAYIPSGSQERNNTEGRLVLLRLLKAMLDNDGQLSGRLFFQHCSIGIN